MKKQIIVHMELYLRLRGTDSQRRKVGILFGKRYNDRVYIHHVLYLFSGDQFRDFLTKNRQNLNSIIGYFFVQNENDRCLSLVRRIHLLNTLLYPFLVERGSGESYILSYLRRLVIIRVLNSNEFGDRSNRIKTVIRGYRLTIQKLYVNRTLVDDFGMISSEDERKLFTECMCERKVISTTIPQTVANLSTSDIVKITVLHGKLANFRHQREDGYRVDPAEIMKDEDEEKGEDEDEEMESLKRIRHMKQRVEESPKELEELEKFIESEIRKNKETATIYKRLYEENVMTQQYFEYLSTILEQQSKARTQGPPPPPSQTNQQVQPPPPQQPQQEQKQEQDEKQEKIIPPPPPPRNSQSPKGKKKKPEKDVICID